VRTRGAVSRPVATRATREVNAWHGCSCHTLDALRAGAEPWVEVDLARFNPIGSHLDSDSATGAAVLRQMRAAGKAVVGMKILGEGDLRHRVDEALHFALAHGVLSAFTIGAESRRVQQDLIQRLAAVKV
jgi:1-deoxyxylulose-5-phosphate synthase